MAQSLSKHTVATFNFLVANNKMVSARRISLELGIDHQNVYRLVEPLITRRMVYSGKIISKTYRAKHKYQAKAGYLKYTNDEFERLFADAYDAKK